MPLRPMRSESQPKKTKNGVPIKSDAPDECVQRREILQAKRILEEKQGIELSSVPDNTLTGCRAKEREPDIFCVRHPQEAVAQWRCRSLALSLHFQEERRLLEFQPDVNRDPQQSHGKQERDSPTPTFEGLSRKQNPASPYDGQ